MTLTAHDRRPRSLFLFVDESGNFDFSPRGTRYFVMAGVMAVAPLLSATPLQALRYELLSAGHDVEHFHASEDRQAIRDEVLRVIAASNGITAHVVWGEKRRASPRVQAQAQFYASFGESLVTALIKVQASEEFDQVVIVFDKALTKKQVGAFEQAVKPTLKLLGKPFRIFFHSVKTDYNGQIADYVAWSKFVELERGEHRPWAALQPLQPTHADLFREGPGAEC